MRIMFTILAALLISVLAGCGSDGSSQTTSPNGNGETVTITIGNITDLTGPGAEGIELTNVALEDMASYYNDNDLIPGVRFEIVHYDGQLESARTVPGYEWLKQKGADIISTCAPGVAVTLEPMVNKEKFVLFTQAGELSAIDPPGYVFCLGCIPQYEAYTLLSWIAENDWDYREKGPARIGVAAWQEPYAVGFSKALNDYAEAHPDQFKYVAGYLPSFKFNWDSEVEHLKDCDYIFPPIIVQEFAKELRNVGSDARLIGGAPHTGYFEQISSAGAWPAIDGMLFVFTGAWWAENLDEVEFNKMIINEYHPGELEEITRHSGYGSISQYRGMFDMIAATVERTGPQGFSSEALYATAPTWSFDWDYRADYSFGPSKRFMLNDLCIQVASAADENLVRYDPEWYPVVTKP